MRPSLRRPATLLAVVLAVAALVAVGLFPQEPFRRRVERWLQATAGPNSRVGGMRVVPGRMFAEITDLRAEGADYVLEVPRVRLGFAASALAGSLDLRFLELESPRLTLRPTQRRGSSPRPIPMRVGRLELSRGSLSYRASAPGSDLALDGIELHGSLGSGSLRLAVRQGALGRETPLKLGPLRASLRVSPVLELFVESLEASVGAASRLRLSGPVGKPGEMDPDLKLEARIELSDVARIAEWGEARGMLAGEGRLRGPAESLRFEGTLTGSGLLVKGWPAERAKLQARYEDGRTEVALAAELLGGRAEADGSLDGTRTEGRLRLAHIDASALGRRLGADPGLPGAITGTLEWNGDTAGDLNVRAKLGVTSRTDAISLQGLLDGSGRFNPPRRGVDLRWSASVDAQGAAIQRAHLEARGTATGSLPPAIAGTLAGNLVPTAAGEPAALALTGSLRSHGSQLALELSGRGLGGSIKASADARGAAIGRLSLLAESIDLAALSQHARGRVRLDFEGAGELARLAGSGHVRVEDLAWRALELGTATGTLRAQRGAGLFDIELPELRLTAEGRLPARAPRVLEGKLRFTDTPLETLGSLMPPGRKLEGLASGTADFTLPLDRPDAFEVRAAVERLEVTSERMSLKAAQPFRASYARAQIEIDGLAAAGPGVELAASGRFGTERGSALEGRATFAADLSRLAIPESWTAQGRMSADLTLGGTLARPNATGEIRFEGVEAEGPRVPRLAVADGRVRLEGDAASATELTVRVAGGSVLLSGRVPVAAVVPAARANPTEVAAGEQARLTARWEGLQAGSILERLRPDGPAPVSATLAGQARIEGGLASLQEAQVAADVPATTVRVHDLLLEASAFSLRLERGRVAPDEITVRSDAGALRLNGGADLAGRTLDLTASGRLELRALAPFLTDTSLSGVAEMDLAVKGALDDPNVEGGLSFRDASLRLREIPQALTSLQGALVFDARTLRLQDVTGLFGGGSLTMSGSAGLKGGSLEDVRVELKGRDVALRYPEGLRSRLDADLSLTGSWGTLLLSGAVRAQRSLYDLDVAFAETLRTPALKPAPSPTLRQVALDVRVETQNPVLVRNNLGSLQASGSLTARGNMETVEPFGRLEILPGGKVRMQNREFVVSSGSLSYNGSWDPQISLTARTVIRDVRDQENRALGSYSVTVVARGSLDRPELSFSSDPSRPEGEVVGLIVTGRLGSDPMRSAGRMAGEQAALLLAAPLTRGVSRGLRELGFDDVSIQPELLAGETEPGARFTFGKNLTRHVGLVYSLSLKSPEDRFVQLEAHPGRDVALTVQRREDGTVTYGAGQRLRWGGARRARDTSVDERVRLREVEIEGELPETMRSVLKSRPGKKASAWDVQEDADRLRERLIEQGYLEAEVGARIDEDAAVFQARAGPKYTWRVEGMTQPPDLAPTMKEALYEEDAFERGQERLLEELRRRGHLRARIEASAEGDAGARTLVFRVEPGPRIETVDVSFPGATAVSRAELLKAAGGSAAIVASPEESLKRIEAEYRERHYLSARVGPARMTESDRSVRVEVPVQEGTQARVASVAFRGVSLPEDELRSVAGIQTGALYDETRVTESQARIRSHYFERGYPSVRVTSEVVPSGGDVDVVFRLAEGERVVVGRIVLSGLRRTRESLVRRHIPLEVGDPLDPRKLASVERRLLELGVFGRAMASVSGNPATVQVDVEEDARLLSGYDLRYNDEEGASALVDAETRNVFGTGLSVGGRYRVGRDVREGRGTLHFPVPFGPTGDVTASVFRLEEDLPGGEPGTLNERIQDGLQIQHTLPFESRWSLLYGYRFKRVTLTSFEPITIAAVDASLLRDTRDNVLDARSGRFLSFNLQLSPKSVGSDFDFVKGFAQAFLARSLRPSLTWAQGYRLGVAHVLGGEPMPSFERFKAGGGNSLRGFATDAVGPRSFLGDPAGGQAVLILNQELRYHHGSGLGGVVFYDAGNVFSRVRDFGVDLRHAVGFGLRWDSPVGLLRGDVGFPLGRKPGERSYRLFFSLGQAF